MNNEITLRSNVKIVSAVASGDRLVLTFEDGTVEETGDRGYDSKTAEAMGKHAARNI